MANTLVSAWLNTVMEKVGADYDETLIERAVLNAAIEFARETRCHQIYETLTTIAGQPLYSVDTPRLTRLLEVHSIHYGVNGKPLTAVDFDYIEKRFHSWEIQQGAPDVYTMEDEATIRLVRVPASIDRMRAGYTLAPEEGATEIDSLYWRDYKEVIACGAAAYLLSLPNDPERPVTDPRAAMVYESKFQENISRIISRGGPNRLQRHTRRVKRW